MEIRGHGGITHFGNSEGKGGLKCGSRPWYGTDIFWNRPISIPHVKQKFNKRTWKQATHCYNTKRALKNTTVHPGMTIQDCYRLNRAVRND